MKYIDLFESKFLTKEDEILYYMSWAFLDFNPNKLNIEHDGLIYDGSLALSIKDNIRKLKVQIKSVSGYFYSSETNLASLEGCPKIVGDSFYCNHTNITSLKFCPISIVGELRCRDLKKITDPKEYRYALYSEIGGKFSSGNKEIDEIINTYAGSANRKHWPHAINLLSKVKL